MSSKSLLAIVIGEFFCATITFSILMFAQELTQQSNMQKTRLASASGSWLRILTWQVFVGYFSIHAHFMSIFLFKNINCSNGRRAPCLRLRLGWRCNHAKCCCHGKRTSPFLFLDCQLNLVFRAVAPISGQYFTIRLDAAV